MVAPLSTVVAPLSMVGALSTAGRGIGISMHKAQEEGTSEGSSGADAPASSAGGGGEWNSA